MVVDRFLLIIPIDLGNLDAGDGLAREGILRVRGCNIKDMRVVRECRKGDGGVYLFKEKGENEFEV